MPVTDSPAVIVARFLKANHYTETYQAFVQEAGLPDDAGITRPGDWTIEQILEEKKQYDASLNFEKKTAGHAHGWTLPGKDSSSAHTDPGAGQPPVSGSEVRPGTGPQAAGREKLANNVAAPTEATEVPSIPANSNVLCVRGARPTHDESESSRTLFVTFADRSLLEFAPFPPYQRFQDVLSLHNGPILSVYPLRHGHALSTSMSGQLILHGPRLSSAGTEVEVLARRSDHSKYAVQVAATRETGSGWIMATAGWDQKIHVYAALNLEEHESEPAASLTPIGAPAATISLPSNPESFVFVRHPHTNALYLILSRRDSTHLYFYLVGANAPGSPSLTVREVGKQNLAPHATAWIAFSPSCLALSPTDPTLLAVATSSLPHMKLIIVRLLFPDTATATPLGRRAPPEVTQASQARTALAVSDREDAAISLHVSTMAPQTPYSTPQVVWRPDGSGVWVNGDDGVVRGIEVMTGKVVALLKGHEPGTKIRSLWAGMMNVAYGGPDGAENEDAERVTEEECLVSGGFDKKVIIWKVGSRETNLHIQ